MCALTQVVTGENRGEDKRAFTTDKAVLPLHVKSTF